MQKRWLNEFCLTLTVSIPPGTRLLIAEGKPEKDEGQKNQKPRPPQRGEDQPRENLTVPVKSNGKYYLPGSSLKGVLRSRAEYIANTLLGGVAVCRLFDKFNIKDDSLPENTACGNRFDVRAAAAEQELGSLTNSQLYAQACPACQLFGHTHQKGRLRVTDFEQTQEAVSLQVAHNAIDRLTGGGAAHKLYNIEYLTQGAFTGQIILENYELWQLGWLGFLLRDLEDGLLRVGHKQTSGAGKLQVVSATARLRQFSKVPAAGELVGVGELASEEERIAYALQSEHVAIPGSLGWQRSGGWHQVVVEQLENPVHPLWKAIYPLASAYLKQQHAFQTTLEMQKPFLDRLLGKLHEPEVQL